MPINITYSTSSLSNSIQIQHTEPGMYYKYVYNNPISLVKNVKYTIEFRIISDVITPLHLYVTKSIGDDAFIYDSSFGKYVDSVETLPNTIEDKSYIITPISDGTGSLEFLFLEGTYHISDIRIRPYYTNSENPGVSVLTIPNPIQNRKEEISIRSVFIDTSNKEVTKGISTAYSEYTNYVGNNLVISRDDNLIEGSLFVGSSLYSGIEIAGISSAYIRSIGYTGFTSASNGSGGPGFMIWSGSVLTASGDNYSGVGIDMVLSSSNYFRFRTNPSELDIRTDSIFIGNPNTNYISASGGTLEISSSNFLLSSSGDVIMRGTVYADAGVIAGLYITEGYIQNSLVRDESSILFGSSSFYWDSTNFNSRKYPIISANYDNGKIDDLIHTTSRYSLGGTPIHSGSYYYSSDGGTLLVDLSSVDAYYDIGQYSFGRFNIFDGYYYLNKDVYNKYTIDIAGDTLEINIGIDHFIPTKDEVYTIMPPYMQVVYFDENDIIVQTDWFNVTVTEIDTFDSWNYREYSFTSVAPLTATKVSYSFIFNRYIETGPSETGPSIISSAKWKIYFVEIKGNSSFLEISPSGLFYRANDDKYIRLGKGSFEIRGTEIESDNIIAKNNILIGSGSYVDGQLQISQFTPNQTFSGLYGNYNNYYYHQWIDIDGTTIFKSSPSSPETYYKFYNNNNSLIYKIYNNSGTNTLDISGSLRISGSAYINDKLGGTTNSGEVLTFSKTVTAAVGITALPTITTASGGILNISGGAVRLYDNPNHSYFMQRYEMDNAVVSLVDNGITYVIVSGSSNAKPVYTTSLNVDDINESNIVPVLTAYREGDTVVYIDWDSLGRGLPNKLHQRLVKTNRFAHETGLMIGITGTSPVQYLTLTSGRAWIGAVRHTPSALNSEVDPIRMYYHDSPTSWDYTTTTEISQSPQYDSISSGLLDIPNNKFGVFWVFRYLVDTENSLLQKWAIVRSTSYYNDEESAKDSTVPTLPPFISTMGILVGRVIIQKFNDNINKLEVESSFSTDLAFGGGGSVTSHQELSDLQGGLSGEYYHLSATEYTGTGTDVFVRKYNPTLSGSVSVIGDFTATSISETSDRTYKENIIDLENQLDNINKLSPKRFNFIGDDRNQIGLIAQEIREIYPEFVKEDPNGKLSVEYSKLTGVLIKSLQELSHKNNILEDKIQKLETQLTNITTFLNI